MVHGAMSQTTRVDFHCHSTYSDGTVSPRELAEQLAADGVAFAALTDHNTVEGLPAFEQALARHEVGVVTGVEVTAWHEAQELHLLGYGFDPDHAKLQEVLRALRQRDLLANATVHDAVRERALATATPSSAAATAVANGGRLSVESAISLIHEAGGRAFLAHPLVTEAEPERLRELLVALRGLGLDGIEAVYEPYAAAEQERLQRLADELGLLVSAGSDAHDRRLAGGRPLGVEMPTARWKRFRDAVCANPQTVPGASGAPGSSPRVRLKRRHLLYHVFLPTALAMGLFVAVIFAIFLPTYERSLLDRKREMIRELTNSAWSILAGYEREERKGLLSRAEAQRLARERVAQLRYGREGKDYFWLQDMQPRMVMHPYRPDLDGQDLSDYRDPRGVRIFVEFADLVRRQQEGYVDYVWQWKDDPSRLAPKESYVKGFAPWGWIIGTGIYIEDVQREIGRLERSLVYTSLGIIVVVALLLLHVVTQTLRLERERSGAEEGLREWTERYRSLVEATTEGALLVVDGRCRYANPYMLTLLRADERELGLLDLDDVLPPGPANAEVREMVQRVAAGDSATQTAECALRRRDGSEVECVLAVSRMDFAGRAGVILLARPLGVVAPTSGEARRMGEPVLPQQSPAAAALAVGLFRARVSPQGTVVECSPGAARLLRASATGGPGAPLTLAALFRDGAAYEDFRQELLHEGHAERHLHVSDREGEARTVAIQAVLARDGDGLPALIEGSIEDVTASDRRTMRRDALLRRLQASVLFLHEPVGPLSAADVVVRLDTPVQAVVAAMAAAHASAALVTSESGQAIGIFTDGDLRQRVIAAGLDLQTPVHRAMSAPLVTVPEHAQVYEALLAMENRALQHLVVTDHNGRVTGIVRSRDLVQFPNYGPLVLTREVSQAPSAADVAANCRRAPDLAKALLDSGAQPQRVTRMLSAVCDAAIERLAALAEAELGPPPVPYVFLGLGSLGREELVFSSDQDNALVYADGASDAAAAQGYFRELATMICRGLDEAGYPYCPGEVMAQNPRWCQPLTVWRQYFADWVQRAEPQQLLEFSIFFDFRPVAGASELARELRTHVTALLSHRPAFFLYLSQEVLAYKPPVGLFGRILRAGDAGGQFNIKDALAPLVASTRLYALRGGVDSTNTVERLAELLETGVLSQSSHDETLAAYVTLTRLRLEHQATALDAGESPDNTISRRRLTPTEETLLNQALAQIAAVQERISHDFGGGA